MITLIPKEGRCRACRAGRSPGQAAFGVIGGFFVFLLLRYPDVSIEYMNRGLRLCLTSVIPTLFPFMVFSGILTRSGAASLLGRLTERPMRALFGVGGAAASAAILGAVCGFPIGAQSLAQLCERGEITPSDASRALVFCNFPSSAFMISAVGISLLSSRRTGVLLYVSVISAGAICGIAAALFTRLSSRTGRTAVAHRGSSPYTLHPAKRPPTVSVIGEALTESAVSLLSVCAYVSFFSVVVGCISHVLSPFRLSLAFEAAVYSFFELTSGAAAAASLHDPVLSPVACAAAAGWSGLSVHLQIMSVCSCSSGPIPIKPYLISKAVQAPLAAAVMYLLLHIFPSPVPDAVRQTSVLLFAASGFTACAVFLTCGLFFISLSYAISKKLDITFRI